MFSGFKSSLRALLRPLLSIFSMDGQPSSQQVPTEEFLDLPPPRTSWDVDFWCLHSRLKYVKRADFREYQVTNVVRYKKPSGTQHEYLVANVNHPVYGDKHIRVERSRADFDDEGKPRLLENQQGTPPATSGDDITKGLWAWWSEGKLNTVIQEPVAKKSSGSLPSKSGRADDVVKLWTPPLIPDRLIDNLDLRSDPLPLIHLAILAHTVHDNQSLYNLFRTQCYWYSDMIVQVIAKSKSIERKSRTESLTNDMGVCYDNISGKWYNIPLGSVRPKVIAHIQAEFERSCSEFDQIAAKLIAEMEEEERTKQQKLSDAMEAEANRKIDEERAEERAKFNEERAKFNEERAKFNEERVAYQAEANLKFEAYQRHIQKYEGLA